jgi:hypothetical protein
MNGDNVSSDESGSSDAPSIADMSPDSILVNPNATHFDKWNAFNQIITERETSKITQADIVADILQTLKKANNPDQAFITALEQLTESRAVHLNIQTAATTRGQGNFYDDGAALLNPDNLRFNLLQANFLLPNKADIELSMKKTIGSSLYSTPYYRLGYSVPTNQGQGHLNLRFLHTPGDPAPWRTAPNPADIAYLNWGMASDNFYIDLRNQLTYSGASRQLDNNFGGEYGRNFPIGEAGDRVTADLVVGNYFDASSPDNYFFGVFPSVYGLKIQGKYLGLDVLYKSPLFGLSSNPMVAGFGSEESRYLDVMFKFNKKSLIFNNGKMRMEILILSP